jgi:fructose-1,6-bisphosphatase
MKTLVEFIQEQQAHILNATGEFSRLMNDIGIAAKYINREVNKAGLADILGYEGSQNIQGGIFIYPGTQKNPNGKLWVVTLHTSYFYVSFRKVQSKTNLNCS